jgi:outer membrane immunogenic protein
VGRKFNLLASTALATSTVMSGAALAADLRPVLKAPPKPVPVVPPFSWSGCYAGGNAGGLFGRVEQRVDIPGVVLIESKDRQSDFTGGLQVGCNFLYAPHLLVGIEGDINFVDLNRRRNFAFTFSGEDTVGSLRTKLRWLSTVRARLGYAIDRSLIYVTGGLAIGEVKSSVAALTENGETHAGSSTDTRFGWAFGAGYEYAYDQSISVKLEYLHFNLGKIGYSVNEVVAGGNLPTTWSASAKVSGDILRAGFNVKLN